MMLMRLGLLILFLCCLCWGCSNDARVEGRVQDRFSSQGLEEVKVTATTTTNIKEDKKYEHIESTSGKTGEFVLNGLSSKYQYKIIAYKEGYNWNDTHIRPQEAGKTTLLEKPLTLIKILPVKGEVIDKFTGKPLSGVTILAKCLHGTQFNSQFDVIWVQTGEDGQFTLNKIAPGFEYQITATKPGYTKDSQSLETRGDFVALPRSLKVAPLPLKEGVFLYADGNYLECPPVPYKNWRQLLTGISEKPGNQAARTQVWPNQKLFFFPKGDYKFPIAKKTTDPKLIMYRSGENYHQYHVRPVEYFDTLVTLIEKKNIHGGGSLKFMQDCEERIFPERNIFVFGVKKEGDYLSSTRYFALSKEKSAGPFPSFNNFKARDPISSRLQVEVCHTTNDKTQLYIIGLNYLSTGVYGVNKEGKEWESLFFQLVD